MPMFAKQMAGRAEELRWLDDAIVRLGREARPVAVEVAGEPGIGKTRLLAELARRADDRGLLVLAGRAAEQERDLPFWVFVDALDAYVEGLDPRLLASLNEDLRVELAHVLPSMSQHLRDRAPPLQHERYRTHRAVRELLRFLAATRPLVLVLDDLHWADPGSIEMIGALLRRPPAAGVLMALALRPRQVTRPLSAVLDPAHRSGTLSRLELRPLTRGEAGLLLGATIDDSRANALYDESGGNPLYLEQLSRPAGVRPQEATSAAEPPGGFEVPPMVAVALTVELASLSETARRMLEGAAVVGDPFELDLATEAAALTEAMAMESLDELMALDLVRHTSVPRRFEFRHPLVRHAVYEAMPGGWRLAAHKRSAEALATRGAQVAARAHHLAQSAPHGDLAAVAVLFDAGEAAARLAPASAARWFAQALRLLPLTAPSEQRVQLLYARGKALTAAGHFADSHDCLLEAIAIVPDEATALRTNLTRTCAAVEQLLGQHEQAHRRLAGALADLPQPVSPEAVTLMIELALNDFYRTKYTTMQSWGSRALSTARRLGNPPLTAAAAAMLALGDAMNGATLRASPAHSEAAELVESLSDDQLAERLDAAAWLAGAELYLDRYAAADAHAERALTLGRATGQGELFLILSQILGRVWLVRGRLAEAADLLEGAIEAARHLGNTQALIWNLFNRSAVALAAGDVNLAAATAQESVDLSKDVDEGFVSAWAAVRLAEALLATGQPARAVDVLLASAGGEQLTLIPGGWRAYCLELLTRCSLALDHLAEAQRSLDCAESVAAAFPVPMATAWAKRAAAAIAMYTGDPAHAAELALVSAEVAEEVGAPIEAALARTLAGRALAQASHPDRAGAALKLAAAELDACGALGFRSVAERELRRLGHPVYRRTRPGKSGATGVESLTERELEIARLVVERKTNPEIAATLFLSLKTVETHLHNIFGKLNVSSRVEVARTVEIPEEAHRGTRMNKRQDQLINSENWGPSDGHPREPRGTR
jgi:DNA-binding CsgD family transcriptional regulator/tetratricopeptide (TPR) repeat protein